MFTIDDARVQTWLNDLVTTKAGRTKEKLVNKRGTNFCCLGRACVALDPKRDLGWKNDDPYPPTDMVPGLTDLAPLEFTPFGKVQDVFACANDDHGLTFDEIALLACFIHIVGKEPNDAAGF